MFFQNMSMAAQQVAILYLIVAVGFIADRIGVFKQTTAKKSNDLLFYIVTPAVMIQSFMNMEFKLETAGAEERGGRSLEQLNSHGICKIFVKINDTALQKTFDAVNHAINLVITLLLGLIINTADRSVDDSCRAAGLSDYTITLTHSSFSFFKNFKNCCYCV